MESFWLQLIIGIFLLLLASVAIIKLFTGTTDEKSMLKQFEFGSIELKKALEEKSQLEYHLNWAKHSGDDSRVDQLQYEMVSLDLKISQLKN